ncbi:hypothetical protein [Tepidibacter hydrothermalis]|uniref:Uncharacterized protein n=1 Tax=Tepidibacter hydrothermalis TaxID=3036126 RepID=A0ABY8EAR0_9FIRM|nr:hypothetical protein [Tepidibacter hydrothermalis]WFD10001.1 hypothetical protein P4S50_16735 [Tepidibacter hydrothermalis]
MDRPKPPLMDSFLSARRECTVVQMEYSMAELVSNIFKVDHMYIKILLHGGISKVFGSVVTTEIVAIGEM